MDGAATLSAPVIDARFVDRFLRGEVDEAASRRLVTGDPEVAAFTLLAIQQRVAAGSQARGPHTPPGTLPPYEKPVPRPKKSRRKRGGQEGHPGRRRPAPLKPDRVRKQQLEACPDCGGKLKRTGETRERFSEDIPEDLKPVITKDVIHRDWCPACRKRVEAKPPDLLPRAMLGNRATPFSTPSASTIAPGNSPHYPTQPHSAEWPQILDNLLR